MTGRKFFADLLKFADSNDKAQTIISQYEKGLLTYTEAQRDIIELYTNRIDGKDKPIKEWYIKEYPDDELALEIDDNITFDEVYHAMKMGNDFYDTIGVDDSIVRERIFDEIAYILHKPYDEIFHLWLETT